MGVKENILKIHVTTIIIIIIILVVTILSLVKGKPVKTKEQRLNFEFSPTVGNVEGGLNSEFEVSCDNNRNLICLVVEISETELVSCISFVKSIKPTLENGRKVIRISDRVKGEIARPFSGDSPDRNSSFDEYETHNKIKVGDMEFNYLVKLEDMRIYEIHSPNVDDKIEKFFHLVEKRYDLEYVARIIEIKNLKKTLCIFLYSYS
jgi:hypothetical protein